MGFDQEIGGSAVGGNRNIPHGRNTQQRFDVWIVRHGIEWVPEEEQHINFAFGNVRAQLLIAAHRAAQQAMNGKTGGAGDQGTGGSGGIQIVVAQGVDIFFNPAQQGLFAVVMGHQCNLLAGLHRTGCDIHHAFLPEISAQEIGTTPISGTVTDYTATGCEFSDKTVPDQRRAGLRTSVIFSPVHKALLGFGIGLLEPVL